MNQICNGKCATCPYRKCKECVGSNLKYFCSSCQLIQKYEHIKSDKE